MNNTEQRIENIKNAIGRSEFDASVEPGDPVLSAEERRKITEEYFAEHRSFSHKVKTFFAERAADIITLFTQRNTEIKNDCFGLPKGAIITVNHFSPLDSTAVRKYLRKNGGGRLNIVARDKNFAMRGYIGFLMRYTRTIPLPEEPRQLASLFTPEVERVLRAGEYLLIYPEAEMWQNYRKPRPLKIGAYHYAARFCSPIIPMFCEITEKDGNMGFRLHVGEAIFPDMSLDKRARAEDMRQKDFEFKKAAYEKAYGKSLNYTYEPDDIACSL